MFSKIFSDTTFFPFPVLCSTTKTSGNIRLSVSPLALDKVELQGPNAEEIMKSGRVYRHTRDRKCAVHERRLRKQNFEKNPPREQRKDPEDDGRIVINKDTGGKFKGGSANGLAGQVQTRCSTKCVTYGGSIPAILQALDTVEDLDEALRPWEKTLNNRERSIILKEQKGWERALEIFEWFKKKGRYELNVIHYTIMIRILGKARKWSQVEVLWDDMMARGIVPVNHTYGTLIDVYSKGGRKEEALLWLERMNKQGLEPNEVIMATVVQLYKKVGEFQKALEFFKKWSSGKSLRHKEDATTSKVCLNPYTYNTLIDMYGKAGQLQEAIKTFAWMVREGVMPTTVTFTTLIHICGEHGQLDQVNLLMQKMEKLRCPPNTTTYNTLIDVYGKAGQLQEASKTFERMLREGVPPTTVTFNTMIHVCGSHGQLDEVTLLMQKMEDLQCPPDTTTYNILISLHAKHDDINMATCYFGKMKEAGLEPNALSYRTLLHAYSTRHIIGKTEDLLAEMDERGVGVDEFTQAVLTRMYIEAGMLEKAWLWFRRFHLTGNMSSECYSANIDAYGENQHILEAEKVFTCCQERKKLSVLECNVMIKAYGIGKNFCKACRLLDSMESQGVIPDRCTYGSLIHILASADMPQLAISYLRKMQEAGLVSNCVPYCAVISSFVKLGQLEMAEGLYEEMIGYDVQPDAILYGVLTNAFADAGRVKEAARYVLAMKSAGLPGDTYKILINLYANGDYLQEAQEIHT